MNGSLFPDDNAPSGEDAALIAQYERTGRTLDDLPYTSELSALCAQLGRSEEERAVLDRLLRIRKSGGLPKAGVRAEGRTKLDCEHESVLAELVVETAGSMGKRDRLPHTPAFETLVTRFNERCGLALSAHDLWRVVARLAK